MEMQLQCSSLSEVATDVAHSMFICLQVGKEMEVTRIFARIGTVSRHVFSPLCKLLARSLLRNSIPFLVFERDLSRSRV